MSEAELHVIRARLQGGILNKARRGELQCPLPVGLMYNSEGRPSLDPDKQVQDSIRFLFDAFCRTGFCLRCRQGLPPETAPVSATAEEGAKQRRTGLGRTQT